MNRYLEGIAVLVLVVALAVTVGSSVGQTASSNLKQAAELTKLGK